MNHQEIMELLPWYVNATLDEAEQKIVANHLAGCDECVRELRSLTAMRKAVIAVGDQAPEPSPFLLNRALAEIETYERERAQVDATQPSKPKSFRNRIEDFRASWWPDIAVFARLAMAAQLALLVVVGAVALYQYQHPQIVYRVSSEGTTEAKAKATISVRFNEKATEREIRQALTEISGTIVDGPSAQGFYTVQLPFAPDQTTELDKAVQKLLQNRRVVSFAAAKP